MFPPRRPTGGDAPIRSTDNDAAVARVSAVKKGYCEDPFINHFVPRAHFLPPRPPLINIGTYVRSAGIDILVNQWLSMASQSSQRCQIVSLGAGSDTRFWRIAAHSAGPSKEHLEVYVEMDFPEITTKKAMAIRKSKELVQGLGDPADVMLAQGGTALHSPRYHLLPVDLRLDPSETLEPALCNSSNPDVSAILNPSLPTLVLFECVLVYMSSSSSLRLLEWFVNLSKRSENGVLGCVIYEMFGLGDAFGRVMIENLKERNISLPGAELFPTIASVPIRFLDAGFSAGRALTLKEIRKNYISAEELERQNIQFGILG
ncbi:hypothetical protein HYPSUDRAFT_1082946 [Hypholoma sublateritium FD-334 SS-4]|uniref:Leucine carboxyl methyltransferase 1 n=1 Tax=Hypholoma sublateritium (strain FD-334 SS-4) TaxID=945553 RepID=A0A0D2MXR8_HYPSF|nr:hypothetical protein HYPSUDRAFT_1082946 [Hypholoma sublateritium FD-334 SS-4]